MKGSSRLVTSCSSKSRIRNNSSHASTRLSTQLKFVIPAETRHRAAELDKGLSSSAVSHSDIVSTQTQKDLKLFRPQHLSDFSHCHTVTSSHLTCDHEPTSQEESDV